ncbi:hypothetical protein N665_0036s0001 [Sinapis alba]|nr:hypothetical protein N665_0036s0001 [Sinapis alba]
MNDIIYLSSDEEDHKLVDHTDFFDDDKPKRTKQVSEDLMVEEDDDCVVLDGDPYKTKEKQTTLHTCEADYDILVLGQKGECHCYICEIRAPCPHWCIRISATHHCHANDKDQIWKNQREYVRTETLLPPQNTWHSPVNQFGPPIMVTSRPNTYIRPGYKLEQPRTFPQNLQPQLYQNQNGRFNHGNYPTPQVFTSKSLTWTQRPSVVGATPVDVAKALHFSPYANPLTALQGNSQQMFGDYVSTLTSSHTNRYGGQFSRTPSGTPTPPGNEQQQQQQQRSIDKVLSEMEDWLMDNGQYYP